MSNGGWIAYVGPFLFPWGQPGSRRVFGIASALAASGHNVLVASGQWGMAGTHPIPESRSIHFSNVGDLPRIGASVSEKLFQLFYQSGEKTVKWLSAMPTLPKCVIVYGAGAPFIFRIAKWCRGHDVPIVADVVEWYDSSHMTGGFFGPFHVSSKLAMHHFFPRCSGIIAISQLLQNYYLRSSNAYVVRVPPITDISSNAILENRYWTRNTRIKLVYAGVPGRKDLLETVIRGVSIVDPNQHVFGLQILGPSLDEVIDLLGGMDVPDFVEVLGRIPQEHVAQKLQEADFSVLIREPKRFANAGFPTKFVESLMNGTPVIANYTSDLSLYLRDGIEGIVCADHSASAFASALKRVMDIPFRSIVDMRRNARSRAVESFDYRRYADVLSDFMDVVSK